MQKLSNAGSDDESESNVVDLGPENPGGILLCGGVCLGVVAGMAGCALFFAWICGQIVIADVNDAPSYTRSLLFLSTANLLDAFPDIAFPPPPPPF